MVVCLSLLLPTLSAAKCTSDLPDEVFSFFHEKPSDVDCDNYEYKFADLTGKKPYAIIVFHYIKSCEAGICNSEVFEKRGKKWERIATIPGRTKVVQTMTNGRHDISAGLRGQSFLYVWDGETYKDQMTLQATTEKKVEPKKPATPPPDKTPAPDKTPQ